MKESAASVSVSAPPHVVEIFGRLPDDTTRAVSDEINEMLKYYAFEDAIFLAELYYETEKRTDNPEALLLYADCLYRANRKEECYGLLRSVKLTGARLYFLFAKVAFDLNKVDECRGALFEHDNGLIRQAIMDEPRVAAHANLLHAQMLCDENHMDLAFEACQKALDENILLWTAIITYLRFGGEELPQIFEKHREKSNGSPIPSPAITINSNMSSPNVAASSSTPVTESGHDESSSQGPSVSTRRMTRGATTSATRESTTPANVTPRQVTPVSANARTRLNAPRKSSRLSEMATRRTEPSNVTSRSSLFVEPDRPHTRATHSSRNRANAALNSDTENSNAMSTRTRSSTTAANRGPNSSQRTNPTRTSTRIGEASKNTKASSQRKRNDKQILVSRNSNLARSLSGSTNSVTSTASERPTDDEVALMNAAVAAAASAVAPEEPMDVSVSIYDVEYKRFFDLYQHVAYIEEAVSNYNWKVADGLFAKLDKDVILNASMIRLQLGRACFEQAEYRECRLILEDLHNKKKWKVAGTEWLSTSMWHLQDTHALSALTQVLTSDSRERPQTWCAAGNCFSLQRQHSQAIECIERALQLDKRFAYAYTLLGHELIVQDELDKAAGSFRSALLLSPRDYRAWYGLGLVHLKKEQNLIALANIQKAVSINPTNRAMLCTLSQIEQQRGQTETALVLIDRALLLNPLDVACRFNRARLLFEAKRNEECLIELDKLKASSPDEAFVFHLLARVHRRMGNTHLALLNYSWAAELDPRGEQNITDANNGVGGREEYEDDEYGSPV